MSQIRTIDLLEYHTFSVMRCNSLYQQKLFLPSTNKLRPSSFGQPFYVNKQIGYADSYLLFIKFFFCFRRL